MKLSEATNILKSAGIEDYREEARLLFCELGKIPRYKTVANDPDCTLEPLISGVERRAKREPMGYILGKVSFCDQVYEVTPDTLIPRPDTECLVEYAVKNLSYGDSFIDLCTGSGCVAISTLAMTSGTTALAVDISEKALKIAERNAVLNGVAERLTLLPLDVLGEELPEEYGRVKAVLSNPPYVTSAEYEQLQEEIYFEPKAAFVGGEDGGDFYRAITNKYKHIITSDGFIAYEIGYRQSDLLHQIAEDEEMSCEILRDLGGNPRVAVLKIR